MYYQMSYGHHGMDEYGYGGGFGPADVLVHVFLFIAAIIFIVALVRMFGGRRHWRMHHGCDHGGALDILKERYAKGEISKKDFDEIKKDILS